jgi:hypothetical protein
MKSESSGDIEMFSSLAAKTPSEKSESAENCNEPPISASKAAGCTCEQLAEKFTGVSDC